MSATPPPSNDPPAAREAAAWVLRSDRGLTPAEQDEFCRWLGADPVHASAYAEQTQAWAALNRLADLAALADKEACDPDLLAPSRTSRRRRGGLSWFPILVFAAAAALAVGVFWWTHRPAHDLPLADAALLAQVEERALPDGSTVALNTGAVVTEHFQAAERRVKLQQGEAHFCVAHDTERPFLVEAGGVIVRAVGTAFDVRLHGDSVEVFVTEGKVRVIDAASGASVIASPAEDATPLLVAGEQAVVPRLPDAPAQVARLSREEITRRLQWQQRLLDFSDAPLSAIVTEFNRRNAVQLSLDPSLEDFRLSATFRSDNIEGFVRLLESNFGMQVERRDDAVIVLSRAR